MRPAAFLFISLLLASPAALRAQNGVPPVEDLRCTCLPGPEAAFLLEWRDPPNAQIEGILVYWIADGDRLPVAKALPGDQRVEVRDLVPPGAEALFEVVAIRGNEESPPARCAITCPQDAPADPMAIISQDSPRRVVQQEGSPVLVVFDGSGSVDSDGIPRLEYFWSIPDPQLAEFVRLLDPRSVVTRLAIAPLPADLEELLVPVRLDVVAPAHRDRPARRASTQAELLVVREGMRREPIAVHRIHPIFLSAVATPPGERGGPAHPIDFHLTLELGAPYPLFKLVEGPPGLRVDELTGHVQWIPRVFQSGRVHRVALALVHIDGEIPFEFEIRVFDPTTPPVLYDFGFTPELPGAGADGGGAGTLPPDEVLGSRTQAPGSLDVYLHIPGKVPDAAQDCVVQKVVPEADGPDLFPGVRFDPTCAAAIGNGGGAGGTPTGGYYYSGGAASTLADDIIASDEFTLEVWVSQVADTQPGAGGGLPAFIFSQTDGTSVLNWVLGADAAAGSAQTYLVRVETSDGSVVASAEADFSDSGAHQIVFVRERGEHRLYFDDTLVTSELALGDLSVWSTTATVQVGAGPGGSHPFTGDVLAASVYAEALSDAMVGYLFSLGPNDPDPGSIGDPLAVICPDPHEIIRTRWGAIGSESTPGIGGGGGGGGMPDCDDFLAFLYPCEWIVTPDLPGVVVHPATGFDECLSEVEIELPPPESGGAASYELRLRVRQLAVRGDPGRESLSDPKTVRLPGSFVRGDTNDDGIRDISDPVLTLLWLFSGAPEPGCLKTCDIDDNERIDITDPQLELMFLFQGGAPPPPPGPSACGFDSGAAPPDWLSCDAYLSCPP